MNVLLDTNILIRNENDTDPLHRSVSALLDGLLADGDQLCIVRQNLYEYWAMATRPAAVNGLGLEPAQARKAVDTFLASFVLVDDPPDLLHRWLELCTHFQVRGRPAHDARLVACMQGNGIGDLVTLNPADFARYPEIHCITAA